MTGEVLQSTALAYDTNRRLRFELCGCKAYMPYEECLDTSHGEALKDIAVLTRVGRPTCFVITDVRQDENGESIYLLSRASIGFCAGRLLRKKKPATRNNNVFFMVSWLLKKGGL